MLIPKTKMAKVMVVDDNATLARAIARTLADHEVTAEVDSTTALERVVDAEIDGAPYDVVVCDVNMPRKTGVEVLETARALAQPPIFILISGHGGLADVGADAVLLKPFAPSELRALIACLLAARTVSETRRLPRCG